jgi:hypothetical protein
VPPPCEPSVAGPARSRVLTGIQRSPKRRRSIAHQALPVRARVPELLFSFLFDQATCPQGERERATSNDRRFGPARRNVHILDQECLPTIPRRHALLKFKRLLMSMFTALDFVVGNENYGGEWALIYDTTTCKAHKTYPPPTSAPRKRVHRHTQLFLHRILLDIFSDHCPAIISDYLETSKYDNEALQDDDGHPYCVGTTLLQAIERHCVPTDDETSMTVQKQFETLLNGFPGIISVSSFRQLEKWADKTADQWNRLSPYDDTLRSALPRCYLQMLDHQLRSRQMANLDRIDWGEFKAYLNKNEQWLAKNDIPVYLSSLIAFASSQLEALAQAEGMTGTASSSKRAATAAFADPNDNNKRQRFAEWGAQVAASIDGDSANIHGSISACPFCGRHHSLAQCRGVQNLIAQHK